MNPGAHTPPLDRRLALAAKTLSFALNPNFCQLFIFLYLRREFSAGAALLGFVFLVAVPLGGYVFYLKKVLKRDNLYVLERNKRYVPFLINIGSALALVGLLHWLGLNAGEPRAELVNTFLLFVNGFAFLVTMFWRISIHQIAAAACAAIVMHEVTGFGFSAANVALVATVALVGWSRLFLRGHNALQVAAGSLAGFACALLLLLFRG